ncbi:hypothetical protein DFP80_10283 [Marinomonas rhizomae]|uniref:Uncharacterized protein n=1 Tax=Marinomonas rhizomae TaxID=491948 RepID=A0A366JDL9_9GAMM|nr:hypothetical protein DFP80_10283 [Marinomonas rhizomae]
MSKLQLVIEKAVEVLVLLNELIDSLTVLIHSLA